MSVRDRGVARCDECEQAHGQHAGRQQRAERAHDERTAARDNGRPPDRIRKHGNRLVGADLV